MSGNYLVTGGNEHHPVEGVRLDHYFNRIGDHIPRRQGISHAIMSHGQTIAYGDGVELEGQSTSLPDALFYGIG